MSEEESYSGFYDFKDKKDVSRYVNEFNETRDELVKIKNELDKSNERVKELETIINDNQKALADANKRWDFLYRMGTIEYDDYFSFQQYLAAMEI